MFMRNIALALTLALAACGVETITPSSQPLSGSTTTGPSEPAKPCRYDVQCDSGVCDQDSGTCEEEDPQPPAEPPLRPALPPAVNRQPVSGI